MTKEDITPSEMFEKAILSAAMINGKAPTAATLSIAAGIACGSCCNPQKHEQINSIFSDKKPIARLTTGNFIKVSTIRLQLIKKLLECNIHPEIVFQDGYAHYQKLLAKAMKKDSPKEALKLIKDNFQLGWDNHNRSTTLDIKHLVSNVGHISIRYD